MQLNARAAGATQKKAAPIKTGAALKDFLNGIQWLRTHLKREGGQSN